MAKYRKRPVTVEAVLFDGELVGEPGGPDGSVIRGTCPNWFPALMREVSSMQEVNRLRENEVVSYKSRLYIGTLEGAHEAKPGDMIIKGTAGELYPCKPAIFAEVYEATPLP